MKNAYILILTTMAFCTISLHGSSHDKKTARDHIDADNMLPERPAKKQCLMDKEIDQNYDPNQAISASAFRVLRGHHDRVARLRAMPHQSLPSPNADVASSSAAAQTTTTQTSTTSTIAAIPPISQPRPAAYGNRRSRRPLFPSSNAWVNSAYAAAQRAITVTLKPDDSAQMAQSDYWKNEMYKYHKERAKLKDLTIDLRESGEYLRALYTLMFYEERLATKHQMIDLAWAESQVNFAKFCKGTFNPRMMADA